MNLKMENNFKPKIVIILILIIGALILLIASYGCALDWMNKLEENGDWTGNVFYHPLTGVTSIVFFTLSVFFFLERISPGLMKQMCDYLDDKNQMKIFLVLITIISLILLIIDAFMLLVMYPANFSTLVVFHVAMGILFGICLTMLIIKSLTNKFLKNPSKWQKNILIFVIVILIIFASWLIISVSMGRISN
jgi:hypothetical protein